MENHMDDCALYREEIELDDEANFSENFQQHLRYCLKCLQYLKLAKEMDDIIRIQMKNLNAPIGLREKIASRLITPQLAVCKWQEKEYSE